MMDRSQRWRRYIIARHFIALGEDGLYKNFTWLQLWRMSEALRIPRKTLNKISRLMGLNGSIQVKRVLTAGLISWAQAVNRRDKEFFLLTRIEID